MRVENPALRAFVRQLPGEFVLAQVLVRPQGSSYELRHSEDAARPRAELEELAVGDLQARAEFTAEGAFRPLRSAPTLARGWRSAARDDEELGAALNSLYPGAIADWHAARAAEPPATPFRVFAARQSGIYREVALLGDPQSDAVARSCCDARFCLKRRLWTTPGLPPEESPEKSAIPCLEPCALLLELARNAARLERAGRRPLAVGPEEVETIRLALASSLLRPNPAVREGDFASPENPRRIRLLLDRLEKSGSFGSP